MINQSIKYFDNLQRSKILNSYSKTKSDIKLVLGKVIKATHVNKDHKNGSVELSFCKIHQCSIKLFQV